MQQSIFPNDLKTAKVCPIHKKNSLLDKGNIRPVSVLPTVSKRFERAMHLQLTERFNHIFNPFFSSIQSRL
jgi:hypothetical protein